MRTTAEIGENKFGAVHSPTMHPYFGLAAVLFFASIVKYGNCYRILGIFPTPSISHQVVFRALTLELNKRGHELVVLTPNPIRDTSLVNYTEIDTSAIYETYTTYADIAGRLERTSFDWLKCMGPVIISTLDEILDHPDLRMLYAPESGEKFDLLLVEVLFWDSMLSLAKRFDVPTIGISSLGLSLNIHYAIGNPILSHQLTTWELRAELSKELSVWQRFKNFFTIWRIVHWYRTSYMAQQQAIARKYFGNDIPDLNDLWKNVSLIFTNQQGPISYARPNLPKVIEISGFHISKDLPHMPKELQKILDEATEGFIYMSLGSNAKSKELPKETRDAFIAAFSRLPYKVLWKFEDNVLPNKPKNVHIMKWVPQQAVLAHPNLKVFLYQGGVQSTEEAVTHGVPLIGFPVFGDQDMQVTKMASIGVAKKLEITTVDENQLFEAINTVVTDTSYKQKMLNLRSRINDKPHDPLENAVWWTEHVIRHKGAPHLHSIAVEQPWYSRQDMDIVAAITAAFLIMLGSTLGILYHLMKSIHHTCTTAKTLNRKKMKKR